MANFLPSFFQKRILRYALSRLELLDTDALDLEKLDIMWGRKSTVELRDVGIRVHKVSALLKLPRSLVITKAKISTLRVTVPADLYQSGIVVEVQGVEVGLKVEFGGEQELGKKRENTLATTSSNSSRSVKADRPRSTRPQVHDPGGWPESEEESDGDDDAHLPTSEDLAQSFLQAEPIEERSELQAVVAQSLHLNQSHTSSEDCLDASEVASEVGMGNDVSLPGFLAGFLKGVGDRVQVKIDDVHLDLVLKLETKDDAPRSVNVKVRMGVKSIVVDAVSNGTTQGKNEARRISMSNIQCMLISEPSLFSNLAPSTAPPSPETTHASAMSAARGKPFQSSPSPVAPTPPIENMEASIADLRDSQASYSSVVAGQYANADHEVGSQASSVREVANHEAAVGSIHEGSMLADSFYSSGGNSANDEEKDDEQPQLLRDVHVCEDPFSNTASRHMPPRPHHNAEQEFTNRDDSPPATFDAFPPPRPQGVSPQTESFHSSALLQDIRTPEMSRNASVDSPAKPWSPESRPSSPPPEDLSESKIFSHEQASSMYMSAMSNTPLRQSQGVSRIPGSWISSYPDKGEQQAPGRSGHVSQPQNASQLLQPSLDTEPEDLGQGLDESQKLDRSATPTLLSAEPEAPHSTKANKCPIPKTIQDATDPPTDSFNGSVASSSDAREPQVLAKRVFAIDSIILELPSGSSETASQAEAASTKNALVTVKTHSDTLRHPDKGRLLDSNAQESPLDPAITIKIGSVHFVGDVGLTKLTIMIIEQMNALRRPSSPRKKRQTSPQSPAQSMHYKLSIKAVSWKFLDLVKGVSMSETTSLLSASRSPALSEGSDVLLKSSIKMLRVDYRKTEQRSHTTVSIGTFAIGYTTDEILSFDSELKMRDSTRDVLAPVDKDMILTITESREILSVDLTTLPLHVTMDLRRLDETFGWFGGFSSMLGLGSSMVSTVTLLDTKAKASQPAKSTRGVHFESPSPGTLPRQATTSQQKKITARIGGFVVDLRGTQCALRLEATAMKLVSRTEGVGLQIDRLVLNGPIYDNAEYDNAIVAKLLNVRVEYISTPKEIDLARLLALLSPSKDTYENDDDILLDTLLRQRRKGGVVRLTIDSIDARLSDMDALQCFPVFAEELKTLSKVTKYLPEDDRPGLLTLILVKSLKVEVNLNDSFGIASLASQTLEMAHVTFPALMALGINDLHLSRNHTEELIGPALSSRTENAHSNPVIMTRFIGNEMEPTVKVKLHNIHLEYHVATIMAVMGLKDEDAAEDIVSDMVSSIATLTSRRPASGSPPKLSSQGSASSDDSFGGSKALKLDVAFRDSIVGLNPIRSNSKGLIVLTDTHFVGSMPKGEDLSAVLEIKKAELMVIDNVNNVREQEVMDPRKPQDASGTQVQALADTGYVSVSQISSAKAAFQVVQTEVDSGPSIDVEIRDDLFVLETCADSTQTLSSIMNGLKPPTPNSTALKYQTEIVPVEDLLASFSGDAFAMTRGGLSSVEEDALDLDEGDMMDDEIPQNLEFVSSFYNPDPEVSVASVSESTADSMIDDDLDSLATPSMLREIGDKNLLESFPGQTQVASGNLPLDFQDDHFGAESAFGGVAHRWDPKQNTYSPVKEKLRNSPLRVRVRDVHIIWNLFDGYDWQHTRDKISQAVADVQTKATERLAARRDKRRSFDPEEEDEDVIGDFLFNSIYIGIPAKSDPAELARQVNRNIDDLVSETGSYATSTSVGRSPSRGQPSRPKGKRLRLQRSKHHKLTFELRGVSADVVVFPPGSGETESSIDIRVQDLEIFDHVPTSTWKKFATYMYDAGERESGTSMIHIEILNVKPVPNLAASEIVLKVSPQMLVIDFADSCTDIRPTTASTC